MSKLGCALRRIRSPLKIFPEVLLQLPFESRSYAAIPNFATRAATSVTGDYESLVRETSMVGAEAAEAARRLPPGMPRGVEGDYLARLRDLVLAPFLGSWVERSLRERARALCMARPKISPRDFGERSPGNRHCTAGFKTMTFEPLCLWDGAWQWEPTRHSFFVSLQVTANIGICLVTFVAHVSSGWRITVPVFNC